MSRVRRSRAGVTVQRVLGLPRDVVACLFDLDGVLTETATLHAAAWKATFDAFLRRRAEEHGTPFVPFDEVADYDAYVDGRPRREGVEAFLEARGVHLPDGAPADRPGRPTVQGLARAKNDRVLRMIEQRGVTPFPGSVRYVEAVRDAGLRRAVVSSSANCKAVLRAARIDALFDAVVDGALAAELQLAGKPAPDTYLAAARLLGAEPAHAAIFEDARAGVRAGRAGGFGFVVGVDRSHQAAALRAEGADVVVEDLGQLLATP